MEFDEKAFIVSLINRPEDAKRFIFSFDPEWLSSATLVPVLKKVFEFTKQHDVTPSLKTLHKLFEEEDPETYRHRFKGILEQLQEIDLDHSEQIWLLSKVRELAITRSFHQFITSAKVQNLLDTHDGSRILSLTEEWLHKFIHHVDEETCNIREAIETLIDSTGFIQQTKKIPCGILPLDEWTMGGLRTKNIGVIIAPTGQGKSVVLMNMAYKIAFIEETPVWFVSNELDLFEQTERFLARMTGTSMTIVEQDPILAKNKLELYWKNNLEENLRLTYVNREISVNELEASMLKWAHIKGFMPKVIIIDYMERMRPSTSGWNRDREWQWLGAIAQDLVRLAKRYNIAIWTAAQTNRQGQNTDKIMIEMSQASIRHLQEAAIVIGMHQKYIGDTALMAFHNLKVRHSKRVNETMLLATDLDKMYISKDVVDVSETELENTPQDKKTTPKITAKKRKPKKNDDN